MSGHIHRYQGLGLRHIYHFGATVQPITILIPPWEEGHR